MKRIFCSMLFMLVTTLGVHADDDSSARPILDKLIAAQAAKDYEAFVANGTTYFQAAFSKTQFEAASAILNPTLAKEHETLFLGELNQHGYKVYLYRLHFKDGSDDILGTLSLKDGKVGGILFH